MAILCAGRIKGVTQHCLSGEKMTFDLRLARVVERMAPFGMLEVIWNVTFEPPDTIQIETCGMRVGVNRPPHHPPALGQHGSMGERNRTFGYE
jgi:hypothetical protein